MRFRYRKEPEESDKESSEENLEREDRRANQQEVDLLARLIGCRKTSADSSEGSADHQHQQPEVMELKFDFLENIDEQSGDRRAIDQTPPNYRVLNSTTESIEEPNRHLFDIIQDLSNLGLEPSLEREKSIRDGDDTELDLLELMDSCE